MVILSAVLVHEINYGYQQMTNLQLLRFNDRKVTPLPASSFSQALINVLASHFWGKIR